LEIKIPIFSRRKISGSQNTLYFRFYKNNLEIKGEKIGSLQMEGASEGTVGSLEFYINITQTFKPYPLKNSGKEMGSLFFFGHF